MIGDSITQGIRETYNDIIGLQWPVDSCTSSKGVDNPLLIPMMRLFVDQEPKVPVLIFNNGLHGWHLDDETEYAEHYEKTVAFLRNTYHNAPLFLSLCTHLSDENRDKRCIVRNNVIRTVAEKYGLTVIDLYTVTKNNADLLGRDGVHFTSYKPLCEEVLKNVMPFL